MISQGIYTGKVDSKLEEAWIWMGTLKDAIYLASQEVVRFVKHILSSGLR